MAKEGLQIELAISLHGFDNESRNILMPVNRKYPFDDLMAACRECKNEVIVNVVFKEKRMIHRRIGKSKTFQPITPDDILDIRNFLKNFDRKVQILV